MYVQIEKIYLTHLNTVVKPEVHHNKYALEGDWQYQLGVGHKEIASNRYQVTLVLKAEYKQAEQVFAILSIQQAGNFILRDNTSQQLIYLLNSQAPSHLFGHLRLRAPSLTSHMGVKSFELPLLDFNQIGYQLNQAKQKATPVQENNQSATSAAIKATGITARLSAEEKSNAIVRADADESRITPMPPIPEVALGMTLAKMTKDTVNTGISWWKGEKKEKKAATFVTHDEQEAARAILQKLKEQVRKLLQLNDLEEWCQHSLEDLAEKLVSAEQNKRLSLVRIEKWQGNLKAIIDDYELADNLAHTL